MPRLKKIEVKEKNTKSKQETLSAENGKTTPQQLGSVIKSARDIMRKDRGLSGDSDRLPQLTWLLFLKFIDDNGKEVRDWAGSVQAAPRVELCFRSNGHRERSSCCDERLDLPQSGFRRSAIQECVS